MVPQDLENLKSLLGMEDVPVTVMTEYRLRISMYHRAGGSGPLGLLPLLGMVRSLGYQGPEPPEVVEPVDWRRVPAGTKVEVLAGGEKLRGWFLGTIEHGTLAVKLAGGGWVRECAKSAVSVLPEDAEFEFQAIPEPEQVSPPVPQGPNWSEVDPGVKVSVLIGDNDIAEGEFRGEMEPGILAVKVGDTVDEYKASDCFLEEK